MMSSQARLSAACVTTLAYALLSNPATAATSPIVLQQNGTGPCQVALPAYESLVRRRPLAIQNEGASSAFVTCSLTTLKGAIANDTFGYKLTMVNRSGNFLTLSCTAVIGSDGVSSPAPVFVTKSDAAVNNASIVLTWRTFDGYSNDAPFNVSCVLPPGVGISNIETTQTLNVGN
ncbi:MAG: hypothetical protein ABJA62_11150 [Luteimonas sp.]